MTRMTPDLIRDRRAAALVIVPAVLSIAAILHHPVLHLADHASTNDVIDGVRRIAAPNAAFHAMILLVLSVQAIGLWSVAERLGFDRLLVRAGALFYAVALVLLVAAGTIDGFATPLLASGCLGDVATCSAAFATSVSVERAWIQACTKVGLATQALGLACWALALLDRPARLRTIGALGCVVAIVPIVLLVTSDAFIGPHRLATLMIAGSVWSIGAAVCLWTGALTAPRASPA